MLGALGGVLKHLDGLSSPVFWQIDDSLGEEDRLYAFSNASIV